MRTEVVVALIAGGVALLGAATSAWTSLRTTQLQLRVQALDDKVVTKEELLAQNVSRYREPLLRAVFDLQDRIYSIVRKQFLNAYLRSAEPEKVEYARTSTLFLLAQHLGWEEIVRRGVQFLDLGDIELNRRLFGRLEAITTVLASDEIPDQCLHVFRVEQRAIGELMIEPAGPAGGDGQVVLQCIGYAQFRDRLAGPAFAAWFSKLWRDLDELAKGSQPHHPRLIALQRALLDLIDLLDDPPTRFPVELRIRA
jgi:hypothetical protein